MIISQILVHDQSPGLMLAKVIFNTVALVLPMFYAVDNLNPANHGKHLCHCANYAYCFRVLDTFQPKQLLQIDIRHAYLAVLG